MDSDCFDSETEVEIILKVSLDKTDRTILKIIQSNRHHWYRLREISSILAYEGLELSASRLAKRMEFFAMMDMVRRTKRGRYYSYSYKD